MFAQRFRYVAARSSRPQLSRASLSTTTEKKFYTLKYEYVRDIADRRGPFRAEHLERAGKAKQNGHVVVGGALVNPLDAGVFIFNVAGQGVFEEFVKKDPYVVNQLLTSRSNREWLMLV